ncbi:MAG: rRNA maturation RNase YbeY [Balneolaceae bacterium]
MMTKFPDSFRNSPSEKIELFNPSGLPVPISPADAEVVLSAVESGEKISFASIELVYTNEEGIVDINKTYLQRDYVTDIISFRYDEEPGNQAIEGTLYCCAPRITEQSAEFGTSPLQEYRRVLIHGLLHLAGYNDQSADEKSEMTRLEDHYLETFSK